mgnify:FL=1
MTAINLANIPSNINTYERLMIWAAQCLQNTSQGLSTNVVANTPPAPTCQVQVAQTADGIDRFIVTAYIPCDMPALNSQTQKTWMAAQDIATATPHANLLQN